MMRCTFYILAMHPRSVQRITIYAKATCLTCQQAIDFLRNAKAEFVIKDIMTEPPSEEILKAAMDPNRIYLYLNQHSPLYRKLNMRTKIPSKSEAIKLMHKDPNLIKRPVIVKGQYVLFGFDAGELQKLVSLRIRQ